MTLINNTDKNIPIAFSGAVSAVLSFAYPLILTLVVYLGEGFRTFLISLPLGLLLGFVFAKEMFPYIILIFYQILTLKLIDAFRIASSYCLLSGCLKKGAGL